MEILFVAAEVTPLIKTGGLADVVGSLPPALRELGHDVRVLVPGHRRALARAGETEVVSELTIPEHPGPVRLLRGQLPGEVPLYLVDAPAAFDREGGPYGDAEGHDWPDNAERFALLARAACRVALDQADLGWSPEVVHAHDWHAGLVAALLQREPVRPSVVFTIHNLAYQGLFPADAVERLRLPASLWHPEGVEFWGQLSFLKAGLVYADYLTTVSPGYALEVCTPSMGCGLDGLLRRRRNRFVGILNGVDTTLWDPAHDPALHAPFSCEAMTGKELDKAWVQERLGLPVRPEVPLLAFVNRLVPQKGIELLLEALPGLLAHDVQLVVLGDGQPGFEQAADEAAARHPERLVTRRYSEELAHQLLAGADISLMPSLFEPCGLTQLYSLRYGAVPVVRRTGGLADTVVDANPLALHTGNATGFQFLVPSGDSLLMTVERALDVYGRSPTLWRRLVATGMRKDYSWKRSARRYEGLYQVATGERALFGG